MAAAPAPLTEHEYLHTAWEYEPEYVDGELIERSLPNQNHATVAENLPLAIRQMAPSLRTLPQFRIRVAPHRYRLPDIPIYAVPVPARAFNVPPLAVIEILSPDDSHSQLRAKFEDYRRFGVPYIWLVDPEARLIEVYEKGSFIAVPAIQIPEHNLSLTPDVIFAGLQPPQVEPPIDIEHLPGSVIE